MVSLSVTRWVVSGGTSATGRRCDVVSVTDLRSIANISLLRLDIDVSDPGYRPATSAFVRWRAVPRPSPGFPENGLRGPLVPTDRPAVRRNWAARRDGRDGEEHFGCFQRRLLSITVGSHSHSSVEEIFF